MSGTNGDGKSGRLTAGVVVGLVKDLEDPEGQGRIKVSYPWFDEDVVSAWAPVAAAFGGPGRGAYFAPELDDEALVAFEHGDFNHPFIVGFLWNGADKPPADDTKCRIIRSLRGHEFAMHDPDIVQGDAGHIRMTSSRGDEVRIDNLGITITSKVAVVINAPSISLNGRPLNNIPGRVLG